jgi:LysM repeat protein
VKRRYFLRRYPAVLFFLLLISVIAYADNRSAGVSGERAAGGVALNNTPARGHGDIIASGEHRNYEYYRELEKNKAASVKRSAPAVKKNDTSPDRSRIIEYTVKKGDTLFRIAQNNNVTVREISDLNKLDDRNRIYAGMKLRIPLNGGGDNNQKQSPVKNNASAVSSGGGAQKFKFLWPMEKVDNFKRDGNESVKPIGIIITGPPRAEVLASEAGVVMRTGYMRGFGRYVVVNHGERYLTVYSNLMDVNVKEGDRLRKGAAIGVISEDRTLHFQIDVAGKARNPLEYLPGRS